MSEAAVAHSIDAESSVILITPCAWHTQYIVFAGMQRANRLTSAYTLFNVSWCMARKCSMNIAPSIKRAAQFWTF